MDPVIFSDDVWETLLRELHVDAVSRRLLTAQLEDLYLDLVALVRPDIILEIGAHEAEFSTRCRKLLGSAPTIIAVEANPAVAAKFGAAASSQGVDYRNIAIARDKGPLKFNVPVGADGQTLLTQGSLHSRTFDQEVNTIEVIADTLDSLTKAQRKADTTFALWVDVEGAAMEALTSGPETLRQTRILYVETEIGDRWRQQAKTESLVETLSSFDLVPVIADAYRPRWQRNVIFVAAELAKTPVMQRFVSRFVQTALKDLCRAALPPARG